MNRRAARIDANQPDIVDALRQCGASVAITSSLGDGFPDLVVGRLGRTYLLEIKDPKQPKSKRQLTDAERLWHMSWRGQCDVVETIKEALAVIGCA